MKVFFIVFLIAISTKLQAQTDSILELPPNQSMCITGKGAGQDGAINPYDGEDTLAHIKNIGEATFEIRVENKNGDYEIIAIAPEEKKEVKLLVGSILYLDSKIYSKADVTFKKMKS